jgi:hypothetical protein
MFFNECTPKECRITERVLCSTKPAANLESFKGISVTILKYKPKGPNWKGGTRK